MKLLYLYRAVHRFEFNHIAVLQETKYDKSTISFNKN